MNFNYIAYYIIILIFTGQLKLKNTSVLIVGAGGLGCPSAVYLAAAGIGELRKTISVTKYGFLFRITRNKHGEGQ